MFPATDPSAPERGVERAAEAMVLAASLIVVATILLGSLGLLARFPLAVFTLALAVFAVRAARPAAAVAARELLPPWPLAIGLALLALQTLAALPILPADWDAMTYHLFLPARWLQEGSLVHVPTVFGDESAAFAPQNGALVFAWWMGLAGGDFGTGVVQVAALGLLGAALHLLIRRLGAGAPAAAMAVATLPFLGPIQRWTFSANVDVFMAAFFLATAAFLLGDGKRRDLFFGGLALGLALGTKTLGLPLAAGLAAIAAPRLSRAPRRDLALFAGAALLTGSYWWLRHLAAYGNPLFPLDLSLGSWRLLPGVYDSAALEHSIFHVAGFADWLGKVHASWGAALCLLALLGWAALAWHAAKGSGPGRRLALELALLAAGWTCFVWSRVPHNNQIRFLLPALAIALAGWGLLLDRLPRRAPRTLVCLLAWLALAAAARPDRFLASRLALLASPADPRSAALAVADYALWRDGYLPLNRPGLEPKRIAYSGGNVPYTLVGPHLRNRVVYCNVQGRPDDGLYDFWLARGKARYDTYLPGLYRGREDAAVWLSCLERERIDTVVLFWHLPVDLPAAWQLDGEFPVERRFLRERPDLFRPLLQTDRAEIWSVKPWPGAAPAAVSGPLGGAER